MPSHEPRLIGVCERNQFAALVLLLGDRLLVRRYWLRPIKGKTKRAHHIAEKIKQLRRDYAADNVVVESGTALAHLAGSLRCETQARSLAEVKGLLLPVAVRPTHRALFERVVDLRPTLFRFVATGRNIKVAAYGETDRWRTVVLLASAFAMAHLIQTNHNICKSSNDRTRE